MWWSHCDRDSGLFPRWKQDFDHVSHALTLGSANNGTRTRHRIPLVMHLHQILFGVEFRISGVGIWALVGTNLRQWVWLYQYSQERCQTYMRAYSPQRSLNSLWYLSLYGRLEFFCVVYPIIKFFYFWNHERGCSQWCSHKSIPDQCIRTHSIFEPYQHLYHSRKSNHSMRQLIWLSNLIDSAQPSSQGINALCNVFPSCHGHSPDTGTLTEDMSLFGLFEKLIVARARKLKTLLINLDYRVMLSSDEPKHYNDRQPGRKNTYQLL